MMLARTLLGLAILALAFDAWRSFAAGSLIVGSPYDVWVTHGPASLDALSFLIGRLVGEAGWTKAVVPLLSLPGWLLLAGAAAITGVCQRARRAAHPAAA